MGSTAIATIAQMSRRCTTVKDVPADAFIRKCADFLKRQPKFQVPKWADLVKTGHFKELAPYDEDWFYIRAASIARKIYLRPGVGIGALRNWYGGANRCGTRTTRHVTASRGSKPRVWWRTTQMVAGPSPEKDAQSLTALRVLSLPAPSRAFAKQGLIK